MPEEKPEQEKPEVGKEKPRPEEKKTEPEKKIQNIIRLGETNLDGTKPVRTAILGIRGISFSYANAVSEVCGFRDKKVGDLTEEELKRLDDIINNPDKYQISSWFYNRRKDPESGNDMHLVTSKLELSQKLDIGRMKKIKTYKGVRHMLGLPVRGQRTRSSFRKGKVVGVSKKRAAERERKGEKK